MKNKTTLAYHFTSETLRDGSPIPKKGEWLLHKGPVIPCQSGLHASLHPFDALKYAPGNFLHLVEVGGEIKKHNDDKIVSSKRKILKTIDAEKLMRDFARWNALQVLHLWPNPPEVVVQYIKTGDESIRAAAWDAARAAAWAAARDVARDAARAAAWAASRAAVWDAARDVALAAALAAAWMRHGMWHGMRLSKNHAANLHQWSMQHLKTLKFMRFTRYGEPSSREIDALRQPPHCPVCGDDVPEYGDTCENCDMKPLLKAQEPQKPQNLRAGDRVRHPLRGEGEVLRVDGTLIRVSFGETWGVLPENSVRKI